jgi:hypothetical protein
MDIPDGLLQQQELQKKLYQASMQQSQTLPYPQSALQNASPELYGLGWGQSNQKILNPLADYKPVADPDYEAALQELNNEFPGLREEIQ